LMISLWVLNNNASTLTALRTLAHPPFSESLAPECA